MDKTPPGIPARRPPHRVSLAPRATILLAITFGLCAGVLDLGAMIFKELTTPDDPARGAVQGLRRLLAQGGIAAAVATGPIDRAASTPGVTPTTLKIGNTMAYSGPAAAAGNLGRTALSSSGSTTRAASAVER